MVANGKHSQQRDYYDLLLGNHELPTNYYNHELPRLSVAESGRVPGADDGERWGAGVETQKNVRGEIGGWGRVPFNETYAPSLSTIYDGA